MYVMHAQVRMQEKDFILPESAAIMRYIATTKGVPDHWYPSRLKSCSEKQYACRVP